MRQKRPGLASLGLGDGFFSFLAEGIGVLLLDGAEPSREAYPALTLLPAHCSGFHLPIHLPHE
jgi:hypothetical protein